MTVANTNANAFSAAKVDIGMGGLGNLMVNQGDGNGLGGYDDMMPTAWEEPWGAGLNPGVKLVGGVGTSMNLQYTSPEKQGYIFFPLDIMLQNVMECRPSVIIWRVNSTFSMSLSILIIPREYCSLRMSKNHSNNLLNYFFLFQ